MDYAIRVHQDVDAAVAALDASVRESVRGKLAWTITQLAMTGRALRVKGTRTQVWRRTPLRGNEFYLWWAPADALPAPTAHAERAILLRTVRHHDVLDPPGPSTEGDYRLVAPAEVDPRTPDQIAASRDVRATPSSVCARLVRGTPGTGKTLSLLYAAREIAGGRRVLHLTRGARLSEEARRFFAVQGMAERALVLTIGELVASVGAEASPAVDDPALSKRRFDAFLRGLDANLLGPWVGKAHALWAEVRARLLGMALPFSWRRGTIDVPRCELLEPDVYRRVSGLPSDAAERARHVAELGRRRGLFPDIDAARAALVALLEGRHPAELFGDTGAILVDEVQDLTPVELALVTEVARASGRQSGGVTLLASGDESQTILPTAFSFGLAKDLLRQRLGAEPEDVVLRAPMRSARRILDLVDGTAALYKALPKELRPTLAGHELEGPLEGGRVFVCDVPEGDAQRGELIETLARQPGRAFVTVGGEEAAASRGGAAGEVCFTTAEIKGLDRHTVVVGGLEETLAELAALGALADRKGSALFALEARHLVDGIRVAFSRATDTLVLLGKAEIDSFAPAAVRIGLAELLDGLRSDAMDDEDRARGFLEEAREHVQRGDHDRGAERLKRAEDVLAPLTSAALLDEARELRDRLDGLRAMRLVVAPEGGDFSSLQAALNAARPGGTVVVLPGTYRESLFIERDVEIIGEGGQEEIRLCGGNLPVVVAVMAGKVTLSGLTIAWEGRDGGGGGAPRTTGKVIQRLARTFLGDRSDDPALAARVHEIATGQRGVGATVVGGELRLLDCAVSATGSQALAVAGGASLSVERCVIRDSEVGVQAAEGSRVRVVASQLLGLRGGLHASGSEILVRDNVIHDAGVGLTLQQGTRGSVEGNEIRGARLAGVRILEGASVTLRKNHIGGGAIGVDIGEASAALAEDEIAGNTKTGLIVRQGEVLVRGCRIHHNVGGVLFEEGGRGRFEENDVSENGAYPGVAVMAKAAPILRRNKIRAHEKGEIFIEGGGEFHDNDITGTGEVQILVKSGATPLFCGNRIRGGQRGIVIVEESLGVYERNEVTEQTLVGVQVARGSSPTFRKNRIHGAKSVGVWIRSGGKGTFEDNDISGNARSNVTVDDESDPIFSANRIHRSGAYGVIVTAQGRGRFEKNDVAFNARSGILVAEAGSPVLRENRVHDNGACGVALQNAHGTFESNDVFRNREAGFGVLGGDVAVRGNRVRENGTYGTFLDQGAIARVESNEMTGNKLGGLLVEDAEPVVAENRISGSPFGVYFGKLARGTYRGNDLRGNGENMCTQEGNEFRDGWIGAAKVSGDNLIDASPTRPGKGASKRDRRGRGRIR